MDREQGRPHLDLIRRLRSPNHGIGFSLSHGELAGVRGKEMESISQSRHNIKKSVIHFSAPPWDSLA